MRQVRTGAASVNDLAPIPRFALTREEAAPSLGMSLDSFERYVQPNCACSGSGGCGSCR